MTVEENVSNHNRVRSEIVALDKVNFKITIISKQ